MTANLPLLLIAVALLWIPRSWLRRGRSLWRTRRRHRGVNRGLDSLNGSTLAVRREFGKARNYFDLLRAFAATTALVGAFGVEPVVAGTASAQAARMVLLIQVAIVAVGALIQTVRWERGRFSLAAPVFFLGGMTIALRAPIAGACAFAIAWVLNPVVPSAQGFLTIEAIAFVAIAVPLAGLGPLQAVGAVLLFLPVLLSLLARRPLVVFSRRAAAGDRTSSA